MQSFLAELEKEKARIRKKNKLKVLCLEGWSIYPEARLYLQNIADILQENALACFKTNDSIYDFRLKVNYAQSQLIKYDKEKAGKIIADFEPDVIFSVNIVDEAWLGQGIPHINWSWWNAARNKTFQPFDFYLTPYFKEFNGLKEKVGEGKAALLPYAADTNKLADLAKWSETETFDIGGWGEIGTQGHGLRLQGMKILKKLPNIRLRDGFLRRNRVLSYGDWLKEVCQAKICFHRTRPKEFEGGKELGYRFFSVPLCKTLLLVDKPIGFDQFFKDGKHAVLYDDDYGNLKELTKYYLENDSERRKIVDNSIKEILGKHTYIHRTKELLELIGKNF